MMEQVLVTLEVYKCGLFAVRISLFGNPELRPPSFSAPRMVSRNLYGWLTMLLTGQQEPRISTLAYSTTSPCFHSTQHGTGTRASQHPPFSRSREWRPQISGDGIPVSAIRRGKKVSAWLGWGNFPAFKARWGKHQRKTYTTRRDVCSSCKPPNCYRQWLM